MTTKKLKPTETSIFSQIEGNTIVDAAKLDRLKATACEVDDVMQKVWEEVGLPDPLRQQFDEARRNHRAALLDGHAVEVEEDRFYVDENYDVWDRHDTPDILVGSCATRVNADAFASYLNRHAQRPVSPFGRSMSGFLTFGGGEEVHGSDGYRVDGSVAEALNALWNGEHDDT